MINEVNLRRARLVLGWVTVSAGSTPAGNTLFRYVTGHQVDSAFCPPWGGKISTSQRAVMLCGLGVKACMACLQVKFVLLHMSALENAVGI